MNLLDQLANFCNRSVSINLIEPHHREQDHHSKLPRHHSMTISSRVHDDRHAKSIEKIQAWAPSNKQQSKQKTIFKFARTLNNKTRNHYFYFWVNLEQALKNQKAKPNKKVNFAAGIEKLSVFLSAFETKHLQCVQIPDAFSKLSKYGLYSQTIKLMQSSIGSYLKRQSLEFFEALQQRQKIYLKLDIFMNSLNCHFQRVLKQSFLVLSKLQNKQASPVSVSTSAKATSTLTVLSSLNQTSLSKPLKIMILRSFQPPQCQLQTEYQAIFETDELPGKTLSKMCADKAIENCSEICDNNLLFIQKPNIRIENVNKQTSVSKQKQNFPMKTSPNYCKQQMHTQHLATQLCEKNGINITENKMANNNLRTLPRQRSISSSSILKVDESRMTKLQRKLFGSPQSSHPHDRSEGDENRFSVNGQDWKTDRKALEEIMSTIKLPAKMSMGFDRRRSECEASMNNYWPENNKKQKVYQIKTKQNWCKMKANDGEKSELMKSLLSGTKNPGAKCEKIVISLKSKKVSYGNQTSRNKSEHWQKLYEQERETRRLIQDCQR